ncbi:MAG: hypothetical protein ACM3Q7_00165 [Candidatus Carsonella ruddii]
MNFFKKKFMTKINKKFSFLKINLKKESLIKIIYIETILFLKNKNNINKFKRIFKEKFFSFYECICNLKKSIFNYKNDLFFIKQILFFVIIIKYLLILIIKKILISFYSLNYSIFFIKCNSKKSFKNKDILDVSTKDNFILIKFIFENLCIMLNNILFSISVILYEL